MDFIKADVDIAATLANPVGYRQPEVCVHY
jgi:hypothetical protein